MVKLVILFVSLASWVIAEPIEFSRNPFVPVGELSKLDENHSRVQVIGIIWDNVNPIAFLKTATDYEIKCLGSLVQGYEIGSISKTAVTFIQHNVQTQVLLGQEMI